MFFPPGDISFPFQLSNTVYTDNCLVYLFSAQKRKAEGAENQQPSPKKKATGEPALSKSQLNELAQKRKLSLPTYSSEILPGGFSSTVTFNGNPFKSLCLCSKRKDAEQNAAQVALNALVGAPLPSAEPAPAGKQPVDTFRQFYPCRLQCFLS